METEWRNLDGRCGKPRLVSRTQRCGKHDDLSAGDLVSRTHGFVKCKLAVMPFCHLRIRPAKESFVSDYYCHNCMVSASAITPASPADLTGTQYQLEKFIKHTIPSASYPINSVFSDPSFQTYRDYIVNTNASGCLEIDDQGRKNLVWFAGSPVGVTVQNGSAMVPNNAVKVVYPEDEKRMHAFPTASSEIQTRTCRVCGRLVVR